MTAPRIPWRVIEATLGELPGRPFRRGARGPEAFDCWGLVLEVRARLALRLPPDYGGGRELSRAEVVALFRAARPAGWRQVGELVAGGIILACDAGHAGVHVAGRILHAQAKAGVVTWSLGHWTAVYGPLECWEGVEP